MLADGGRTGCSKRGSASLSRQTARGRRGGGVQEGRKLSERTMETRQNKRELAGSGSLEIH